MTNYYFGESMGRIQLHRSDFLQVPRRSGDMADGSGTFKITSTIIVRPYRAVFY